MNKLNEKKNEKKREERFKMEFEPLKKPDEYKKDNPSKEKYVDMYFSNES